MCCCGKPTVNGEIGAYSWDGKHFSTRQPTPPVLKEGEELIYDEPGRCGGIDSHCHHFSIVKWYCSYYLIVTHGGGTFRYQMSCMAKNTVKLMEKMDSNERYWLMMDICSTLNKAADDARDKERAVWYQAAANKRIKTRKQRGSNSIKVWIEPKAA